MSYIRDHWQGKLSLRISFWINFVLLGAALQYLERFVFPPYTDGEFAVTTAVIVFFVLVRLIIYPWQVVGVLRACERYISGLGERAWASAAQLVVVLSFIATLSAVFSSYQNLLAFRQSFDQELALGAQFEPQYSLELLNDNTLLRISGPLQVGITRAVSTQLQQYPGVSGIVFDSAGGRIYEGRGLAKLIQAKKLKTYCYKTCSSACTTAFISGAVRTLGANARLGFHQYKTYSVHPNLDLEKEQQKDMSLFIEQGIDPVFLSKIFAKPADDMWWPGLDELVAAGVVHRVVAGAENLVERD